VVLTCFETRCDILKAELRHQSKMIEQSRFHRIHMVGLLESFQVHIGRLTVDEDADPFAEEMDSRVDVLDLEWEMRTPLYREQAEMERSEVQDCWRRLNSMVANCHGLQCDKRRSRRP
jgi:hypothetical protein